MRARIDGEVYELDDVPPLDKQLRHRIDLVVDRVAIREGIRQRLADSLETALKKSGGLVITGATGTNVNDFAAVLVKYM